MHLGIAEALAMPWDEVVAWYGEAIEIEKDKVKVQAKIAGATFKE